MSKVLHIRGVPDDVHDALTEAARAEGLSLTRYMLRELELLTRRRRVVQENAETVRRTQHGIVPRIGRESILTALHDGRGSASESGR